MKKKLFIVCLLFLLFQTYEIRSQELDPSSRYSHCAIGQIAQNVNSPFNYTYNVSVSILTNTVMSNQTSCSVAPNPTKDNIILYLTSLSNCQEAKLYTSQGKLLKDIKIIQKQTVIDLNSLPPSIYFLKISTSNNVIESFKIVKL